MSEIVITTLAERPHVASVLGNIWGVWPRFMLQDLVAAALIAQVRLEFADQCLVATEDGELVAHGRSIPFAFGIEDRTELPARGWDQVLQWGMEDLRFGRETNVSSALEIMVKPTHHGLGLSHRMLAAMRDAVKAKGHTTLYAPVRPNGKTDAHLPMTQYAALTRDDGLPVDPWLRVHVRAGGKIVKVAPASMVTAASLAEWREWTGLPFDSTGEVVVPGALVPVEASIEHDRAVYVEPNVWVRHDL
ncbi:GNAT family N-acetyltransferase [Kribbella antibiotica]|uniref:GNAT family N-acetyltransferase n=1 Tax=Kribbella antibiotica TaxID=190195 RepID=A0A4R4ZHX1_9ACTN|nr:GNAT family N-acetyltransferase [Kribbella antibiotica]TDD58035.1 GNAT family N-acetyltransferase [Kribbella antibiotica]